MYVYIMHILNKQEDLYIMFGDVGLQWKAGVMTTALISFFSIIAIISTYVFHDHKTRKQLVGGVGLIASTAMYASPLVVMVRKTN